LILDLAVGRISDEEFSREYPVEPGKIGALGLSLIRRAISERDADGVELGLYLAGRGSLSEELLELLNFLAGEAWHHQHEDIVSFLTDFKSPKSVDVLYKAALARHEYLEYDEAFALGVKAIWALFAIKTREAVERLGQLLRCDNPILAANAKERLLAIEGDQAASEAARTAAREALAAEGTNQR
jgi:glycosyltransferase involved in cell wall biosynthesis